MKKIDSLLRGHIGRRGRGILAETRPGGRRRGAAALSAGRSATASSTSATSAARTEHVAAEFRHRPRRSPNCSTAHAVLPRPGRHRRRAAERVQWLSATSETDADLDAIVAAAAGEYPALNWSGRPRWPRRWRGHCRHARPTVCERQPAETVLTVVGTAAPVARADRLRRWSPTAPGTVMVDADRRCSRGKADTEPASARTATTATVVRHGQRCRGPVERGRTLSAALGRFVASRDSRSPTRSRADRRRDSACRRRRHRDHVTAARRTKCTTARSSRVASDGRRIVTRPGSFGDARQSLASRPTCARSAAHPSPTQRGHHMTP